jgi:hypothetical protein
LEPIARNGLSLACNDSRSRGLHSRVSGPDLLLRSLVSVSRARSTRSSTPVPVCTRFWPLRHSAPVARSTRNVAGCFLRFHSPLGMLLPSGSKRSANSPPAGSPFRFARFPFAPRCRFRLMSLGFGSSFPIRYVSEACRIGLGPGSFGFRLRLISLSQLIPK